MEFFKFLAGFGLVVFIICYLIGGRTMVKHRESNVGISIGMLIIVVGGILFAIGIVAAILNALFGFWD